MGNLLVFAETVLLKALKNGKSKDLKSLLNDIFDGSLINEIVIIFLAITYMCHHI